MKKLASVVCMMLLASHIGVRPSVAAGTQPPRPAAERPLAAAIAAAGHNFGHLLSQSGTNRMSARRETKIFLAAATGFGAGFGWAYFRLRHDGTFDRWDQEVAIGTGTGVAVIAGSITYLLTRP